MEPARDQGDVVQRLCSTVPARLGWAFRDRFQFARQWRWPEPPSVVVDQTLRRAHRLAEARIQDLPAVVGVWGVIGTTAGLAIAWGATGGVVSKVVHFGIALAPFVVGLAGWAGYVITSREQSERRLEKARMLAARTETAGRERHQAAYQEHVTAERRRLSGVAEWSPVTVSEQPRVDVMGGNLRSWCGLLTTFLTSAVQAVRPAVTLDLTGSQIAGEAVQVLELAGRQVRTLTLTNATADRLSRDLDRNQLVDLVVDLVHGAGGPDKGAERVLDARLLRTVCAALEPLITVPRLHAAVRELLGDPPLDDVLTEDERTRVVTSFSGDFVQQTNLRLRVLEAYTAELAAADDAEEAPADDVAEEPDDGAEADMWCVMLGRRSRASGDLLVNLAVQWAARQVEAASAHTVVVAGADRVPLPVLEHLSRCCEEAHAQLVVLFEHLRDDATRFVGGGRAVGFMRLGNHLEAEAAANFIGRNHRFVLSQVTRGYGGQSSRSAGTQQGRSVQHGGQVGYEYMFGGLHRRGWKTGESEAFGTNWGSSLQFTEGTNWNHGETSQRVYEYQVEPTHLQALPDYALLLVVPQVEGKRISSLECCPDIATLGRVSPRPIEALPGFAPPPEERA
jgi:hypothetical protein